MGQNTKHTKFSRVNTCFVALQYLIISQGGPECSDEIDVMPNETCSTKGMLVAVQSCEGPLSHQTPLKRRCTSARQEAGRRYEKGRECPQM